MADLAVPDDPNLIYRYVDGPGDSVPLSRPLCQGDVLADVEVPPFDSSPYVVVMTHPCTMRRGEQLRPYLLVAAVRLTGEAVDTLYRQNKRVMPLAGLPAGACVAKFDEMASVTTHDLWRKHRVACLDDYGIAVLQQRQIHYMTRYTVEVEKLHEVNAPVLMELELLEEWRERAFANRSIAECRRIEVEVDRTFERAFEQYRQQAREPARRSSIRRSMRATLAAASSDQVNLAGAQ